MMCGRYCYAKALQHALSAVRGASGLPVEIAHFAARPGPMVR